MRFECDGQTYDTSGLTVFETDDRRTPFVYLSADGTTVFFASVDETGGVRICRACSGDVRRLAKRYKLDSIRQALPKRRRSTTGHASANA